MSHYTPSTGSAAGPPESELASIQCPCGRPFLKMFPEQMRCMRCRKLQLTADNKRNDANEIEAFNEFRDQWEDHYDDWQLWDPDHPGQLVWAKDLAKRYREATRPRGLRNNLARWL